MEKVRAADKKEEEESDFEKENGLVIRMQD
jgi:hypothetical protein